ncbi:MAG: asparagine synthase (glutamine-hydrolyzing) [Bacteroidetes bacterium]|nr:asparagine synthase (glutamine-hydrolyzing) [Bacteroidota bacterium]
MCGIAGILYFDDKKLKKFNNNQKILDLLTHRGPDNQGFKEFNNCTLFHSRLQILDTSNSSNQPFSDTENRYTMVFNGEIFNYKEFYKTQTNLRTSGDVEVLFNLIKNEGENCLNTLNGFFAFAFFDSEKNALLVARDRLGIKPLYYYKDDEKFAFASELKPLLNLVGKQEINSNQLNTYFRLNYCAGNETIFKNVYRLLPGHFIEIKNNSVAVKNWYVASKTNTQNNLAELLEDAVKLRLHADVPVGTFLSGGIDSSIISALAKKHKNDLHTFSIGFKDESFFDETNYAELVAKYINSNHHTFKLSEDDLLSNIHDFLNRIDEPFADSSAFNFYMLSKFTQKHVKVALSGDGADELFKGYNKHKALLMSENNGNKLISATISPLLALSSGSRQGTLANKIRQLKKFNTLVKLSPIEKQKFLASVSTQKEIDALLKGKISANYFDSLFKTNSVYANFDLEDAFDLQTVLTDDMLVKADRFSMQHGIEIRNPFLDYRVVEFALNLEKNKKINKNQQKIILRKSFGNLLPAEIFERSKKGFEVPLHKWLSGKFNSEIENKILNKEKIESENILNYAYIEMLKEQLHSKNPGDSAAKLWAVIVFESWLTNFKDYIK